MASPAKKSRIDSKSKQFYVKHAHKSSEIGGKGFLVTCNFKERDSIRECYQLLNFYHDQMTRKDQDQAVEKKSEDEDDIASQLENQIEKTKQETKERSYKFQSQPTGVQNLIFIKTTVDDPRALGEYIMRDLFETKIKKTKVTLRMLPIQVVCKAKIEEIKNAAGILFDNHFLKEPSTFAINFNKRFNNEVQREEVIKELADLVAMKNSGNKVNLKDPQQSIIVEVIKGNCLLAVLPDYLKLKKYNINELWSKKDQEDPATPQKLLDEKPVEDDTIDLIDDIPEDI